MQLKSKRGQTAAEYLILIVSVVLLAALVYFFLSQVVFKPQVKDADESSKIIKNWVDKANTSKVINHIILPVPLIITHSSKTYELKN